MSNFDLIDDYLTNKLQGSERTAFEAGMKADPALTSEVEQQRMIIEGIQKARATELKTMLNNVPISGGASIWGDWGVLKMAATIGVAGLLGTTMYYYMRDSSNIIPTIPNAADVKIDSMIPKNENEKPAVAEETEAKDPEKQPKANTPERTKPNVKKKSTTSPKVEVVDPSSELLTNDGLEGQPESTRPAISMATIQVESKTGIEHTFHYQFADKKLFLLGPFDGNLYEILEVHGTNHALFLYFKDNFYLLDESKQEPTELAPIRDRSLVQKLKEFRSKK